MHGTFKSQNIVRQEIRYEQIHRYNPAMFLAIADVFAATFATPVVITHQLYSVLAAIQAVPAAVGPLRARPGQLPDHTVAMMASAGTGLLIPAN